MNDTPARAGRVRIWGGPFLVLSLLVLAVLPALTPFVGPTMQKSLMTAFSMVCHQLPDRSPHWFGTAWAICHRDVGIYFGLPAGALLWMLVGRNRMPVERLRKGIPAICAVSLIPMMIDWGLDVLGVLENTPPTRIITGAIFGITGGVLLAFSLLEKPAPPERIS